MARKPVRPVPLLIGMLAMLATILGVVAVTGSSGDVHATHVPTITHRMTLDPYHINQPPDFLVRSNKEKDVVMHVLTIDEGGESIWHTHPGPSFVIVSQGQVKLTRFAKIRGHLQCVEHFFSPGEGFVEVADEVHKASNVGGGDAVLIVTRLNIPVGASGENLTIPATDPGC